jgi:predicted hotdog family 3-hydroxylacyl-ACP dehydratase
MRLNRSWIERHIPHQGSMCLLDEVIEWDSQRISCRSRRHQAADHPLRAYGRLGIACGIEYASQAMAVHGALTAPEAAAPLSGYLVGVRAVQLEVTRLDDVHGDLICGAVRVAGDRITALYDFDLRSSMGPLMSGRATVILDAGT